MTIKQKQLQLKHLGYYTGKVDGLWGNGSKNATKAFQKAYGLTQDGSFGQATTNKSIQVWKDIQTKLNQKIGAGLAVDGFVGTKTINAIKSFQNKNGLTVDGSCGPNTRAKLNNSTTTTVNTETVCNFNKIKNFKRSEFACGCHGKYCNGFPTEMKQQVVDVVQRARTYFGKTCTVSSGVRCQRFNNSLSGSVKNSMHIRGKAVDCSITGVSGTALKNYFAKQPEVKYTYVITGNWVHVNIY